MVIRKTGKCILSCNSKSCINDSTETFREVICPYHLSRIFGLKVRIEPLDKESAEYYIGPYLALDNAFSFEANTVVFPEREFIDTFIGLKDPQPEFYNFKMNPRMATYLNELTSLDVKLSKSEIRYQLEIIRNLFFTHNNTTEKTDGKITLVDETEKSNKDLFVEIETRFSELNSIIATEDYHKLFAKMNIMSTSDNALIPLTVFTNFMNFMLFNCLTDEHKLPTTPDGGVGLTCYGNLLYKKGVGFVTIHELIHPAFLVISGLTTGINNYYQLKVRAINKRPMQNNAAVYKTNLADNIRSSNILNLQSEYCWKT